MVTLLRFQVDDIGKESSRVLDGSPPAAMSTIMHLCGIALITVDCGNLHEDYRIALLQTPLLVIMGHAFPSWLHPDWKAVSSPMITYGQCSQTTVGVHISFHELVHEMKG